MDDISTFVRKALGSEPVKVTVAEGAPSQARAIVNERAQIGALAEAVEALPDWGCKTLDLTKSAVQPPDQVVAQVLAEAQAKGSLLEQSDVAVIVDNARQLAPGAIAGVMEVVCKAGEL